MQTFKRNPSIVHDFKAYPIDDAHSGVNVTINDSDVIFLNSTSDTILNLCDGNRTVPQIVLTLIKLYPDIGENEMAVYVADTLEQLESLDLVVRVERPDDLTVTAARFKMMTIRRNLACSQVFIIFSPFEQGNRSSLGYIKQANLLDRNLILVNEPFGCYFQLGIDPVPSDFESLVIKLRETLESFENITELYTVGASMGAYAAIAAGHVLGANTAFSFSADRTRLTKDRVRGWASVRFFTWVKVEYDEAYSDLGTLLKFHNGKTSYHLYFGEHNSGDKRCATYLKSCPGVKLYPLDTDSHPVSNQLEALGLLSVFPSYAGIGN